MNSSPLMWYANRGTGLVLLVLYTLTVLVGVLSTRRGSGPAYWPRFVTQGVHRHLSLLTGVLLTLHVISAVVDEYVDISWWEAFSPVGGTYKAPYLGLGALALDATLLVVVTSLLKRWMPDAAWRAIHLAVYPAWGLALVHTIGIGTDASTPAVRWLAIGCVTSVAAAVVSRIANRRRASGRPGRAARLEGAWR